MFSSIRVLSVFVCKNRKTFLRFFSIEDHDNGYMDYQIVQYLIVGYSSGSKEIKIDNIEIGISDCHPAATFEGEHFIIYAVSFQIRGVPLSPMVNYCFERSNI